MIMLGVFNLIYVIFDDKNLYTKGYEIFYIGNETIREIGKARRRMGTERK